MLVRKLEEGVWEIAGKASQVPGRYESREAAIRAIELSDEEKWQVHAAAAARDADKRIVTYRDVMYAIAARVAPPS
jgi:hypothetical protein